MLATYGLTYQNKVGNIYNVTRCRSMIH